MIVGGGFVRDSICGGRIGDIDIWIPNNSRLSLADFPEFRVIFNLSRTGSVTTGPSSNTEGYDRDISNSWVLAGEFEGFEVNIMKSLTNWDNPRQFFNAMMLNFDTELSMMFMCFDADSNTVGNFSEFNSLGHVVIPHSMFEWISEYDESNMFRNMPMTTVVVNEERHRVTSQERMTSRITKLRSRYQMHDTILFDREMFAAKFVSLSAFMTKIACMPLPRL